MNTAPDSRERVLEGIRVLITRAARDVGELRALLEARGAIVAELSTIAIAPPSDMDAVDVALRRLTTYDWIVFTSRNAVHATFDRIREVGLSFPSNVRVATVGPSTAGVVQSRGVRVDMVGGGTAFDLGLQMQGCGAASTSIFLPVGSHAGYDFNQGLGENGAFVSRVIVYETVVPDYVDVDVLDAVHHEDFDVICFASPSAVQNLADMLGEGSRCLHIARLVCIGPTTAAAVRTIGCTPAAVAQTHTMPGLVQVVEGLYIKETYSD